MLVSTEKEKLLNLELLQPQPRATSVLVRYHLLNVKSQKYIFFKTINNEPSACMLSMFESGASTVHAGGYI